MTLIPPPAERLAFGRKLCGCGNWTGWRYRRHYRGAHL